ncbi:replication endonuclease [Shewanella sp. GD04112]|uniref:replication endonuclease n=1 Tax=Shewanella sp. GD04112 TaxID=2975434 RepID=UPI002448F68A|nr:replication endonuclease [Shewanella sp. GD04112]MDH0448714.1 replication endonuclease [Shewanella sp. GD04112]MDH0448725.1 replication endonuclease [Shewanella sp. GD04112]
MFSYEKGSLYSNMTRKSALRPVPSALDSKFISKAPIALQRIELTYQICLSCGHEFEADTLCPCPSCSSQTVYSSADFSPEPLPKSFEVSDNRSDFVSGIYNRLAAYDLPIRDSVERAASSTNWRKAVFDTVRRHGDFAPTMLNSFISICSKQSYIEAVRAVELASTRLRSLNQNVTMTESEVKELARVKSQNLRRRLSTVEGSEQSFEVAQNFLAHLGLSFDEQLIKQKRVSGELFSLVNRACDEHWLGRQLRRRFLRIVENVARDLGVVHNGKQAYCSDYAIARHRQRLSDNAEVLDNTIAVDEDDQSNAFSLSELSRKSISNPEIRRAEMFVRLKGFEQIAKELGHAAVFTTVTSPSRFHAVSNGTLNPKFVAADKPTAEDAHVYLMGVWSNFRKSMDKAGIKFYGMRIVEPHHDATPHHHMIIFALPSDVDYLVSQLRHFAMLDSPDEKGASEHRFKVEHIDTEKGSAVGYCAKYISKSVDGLHVDTDLNTSLTGVDAAERIVSWSRVHGIRQFQFFGGPSVTVWREMRRLREQISEDDAVFQNLNSDEHYLLEKVRRSADEGDWGAFCMAMGGIFVRRADQTVKTHYAVPAVISKLFDAPEHAKTRYGDAAHARVNGVLFHGVFKATRFKNWKLVNKEEYIAARKQVMSGVVDIFDILEMEREYQRMAEQDYAEYERHVQEYEEMQALWLDALANDETPASEASAMVFRH